jgi:group I intron endonuclease
MATKIITGIYCITSPTFKVYVGQSHNIQRRFSDYRNSKKTTMKQTALYRSFLKHGIGNHKFEILTEFGCDIEQFVLDQAEIDKIREFKEGGYGMLNLREGGKSGGKHSDETKKLIREKRKLQVTSDETRKKMSESRLKLKFKHSDETKNKIGLANSGVNNACYGKPMPEYTKQRLRESYKPHPKGENHPCFGKKWSEKRRIDAKGVYGMWMVGKKASEETKLKMSKLMSKPISQFTKDGQFVKEWESATKAAKFLNTNPAHISSTCYGKRKSAFGFKWQFI